jgi:hypothetical protein
MENRIERAGLGAHPHSPPTLSMFCRVANRLTPNTGRDPGTDLNTSSDQIVAIQNYE